MEQTEYLKMSFLQYLDQQGKTYEFPNNGWIRLRYNGDNLKAIDIDINFRKDSDDYFSAELQCWSMGKVPANKLDRVIRACNDRNKTKRWARIFVDPDNDIGVSMDCFVDEDNCGHLVLFAARKLAGIAEAAYPEIMRALWASED